jgi:hypothetical protein
VKHLIALTADKSIKLTVDELIRRPHALGIRRLDEGSWETIPHPRYDSGVVTAAHEFLRSQVNRYRFAVVICDRHGSGRSASREAIEAEIERNLQTSGWEQRCAAVVIDPELEIWLWADSPHVAEVLGWGDRRDPNLREWLHQQGYLQSDQVKPNDPQRAADRALALAQKRRSSAIFQELARRVSLAGCRDAAFLKLRDTLRGWFPPAT